MILNCGTRGPNHGRMPSDLQKIYVQYKQDTRAIIAWLLDHAPSKYRDSKALGIQDLFQLARHVGNQAITMPEIISFHFREAIAARTSLSRFFKETCKPGVKDQETYNHEFFTSSLQDIYAGLCQCCQKAEKDCMNEHENRCHRAEEALINKFDMLECDRVVDEYTKENEASSKCSVESIAPPLNEDNKDHPDTMLTIKDDNLAAAFELEKEVQGMLGIFCMVQDIWVKAGSGETSLLLAALMTSVAYTEFEAIEQRLKTNCDIHDPAILRFRLEAITTQIGAADDETGICSTYIVESMNDCWDLLQQVKIRGPASMGMHKDLISSPSHLYIRQELGSTTIDQKCHTVMLHDITKHIQVCGSSSSIIYRGSPVYAEVGYYLTSADDTSNSLRCTFGLQLLLNSYKSYLFAQDQPSAPSQCRLASLKFAQNALTSIRAVLGDGTMPCRCQGTLAFHLQNLQYDYEAFLQARLFNFYFQSPWNCASHLLEMLHSLFYYGMRLLHYRSYVGSVIHLYNMLIQFTDTNKIPILNRISETFGSVLFPGGRPTQSFKACYLRYMGGRLRFHTASHISGCHSMAVPAHTARTTAGFGSRKDVMDDPRFDTRKIALLYHIKDRGYVPDKTTWKHVRSINDQGHQSSRAKKATHRDTCGSQSKEDGNDCIHGHFHSLHDAIFKSDLSGDFPTAKVNLFAIYLICAKIISRISDQYHGSDTRPGQYCLCSIEALLDAADRRRANAYRPEPLGCKGLIATCKETLHERFHTAKLEDYLWQQV